MNHNDLLFDLDLLAQRAGLPPARETHGHICNEADRAYVIGELRAIDRNPTPEQKLIRDLAARCTIDDAGKVTLPPDTPTAILDTELVPNSTANTIKSRAWLRHRARVRQRS